MSRIRALERGDLVTYRQLDKRAEELIAAGKMPTLQELSAVVLEARRKFAVPIRRARREEKESR